MQLPRFLIDANICIYALSGRSAIVSAHVNRLKPGEAVISAIVYGELIYGAEKSNRKDDVLRHLDALLRLIPVVPLADDSARAYGEIRADLEKIGTPIGNNDLWIAAHAKAAGLTLVSNNEREFKRVRGLKVQNWVKS